MEMIIRHLDTSRDEIYKYDEIESLPVEFRTRPAMLFVTGNKNKVKELEGHNIKEKFFKFTVLDLDLPEIQDSDALNIVQDKCKRAYEHVNKSQHKQSVLIEDTSLHFKALNGMPGPYVKWFLKAVGPIGLHKILAGYDDKTADAVCTYGLMDDESRIIFFRGTVKGKIVSPRGTSWGWDPVFEEERSGLTFGEMDSSMKSKFSHRANALAIFDNFISRHVPEN